MHLNHTGCQVRSEANHGGRHLRKTPSRKKAILKYATYCTETHSPNASSYPTAKRAPTNSVNTPYTFDIAQYSYKFPIIPNRVFSSSSPFSSRNRSGFHSFASSPHTHSSLPIHTVRSQEQQNHTHRLYIATDITSCCPLAIGMLVIISPDLVLTGVESGITSSRAASRFIGLTIG